MKLRTLTEVAGCTLAGGASIALGWHLFWLGGAVEASQPSGGSGNTGAGVMFLLTGLGLVLFPPARRVVQVIVAGVRRHNAWLRSLPPQQQMAVKTAEIAAGLAASYAFHEAVKAYGHRARERYDATNAASAAAAQAWWDQQQPQVPVQPPANPYQPYF